MRMPAPDGAEPRRQVRPPALNASTVIVMITGEQDRTVMARAFELAFEFFLFNQLSRNKLLKLIVLPQVNRARKATLHGVPLRCRIALESGNDRLEGTTLDLSLGGARFSRIACFRQVPPSRSVWNLRLARRTAFRRAGDPHGWDGLHGHSVRKP